MQQEQCTTCVIISTARDEGIAYGSAPTARTRRKADLSGVVRVEDEVDHSHEIEGQLRTATSDVSLP